MKDDIMDNWAQKSWIKRQYDLNKVKYISGKNNIFPQQV